ncbi:MAG: valine--tRNA ligase, partial [Deltaproteobacteria bacterium]|nr:valine--tRNA ligase [Deltaproteobacteria bacterium]
SGCVKVTPAHDPKDFQMGLRHKLAQINVMNGDATMNENVPAQYRGMKREVCRKHLVENLEAKGLIEKIEEHVNAVGHCYRCNTVIEPWLSLQWFVKMKPLAAKAIAATKTGKVKFVPKRWEKFYLSWLTDVRDWCISRQIWWGHRIPVWYCDNGCKEFVAKQDPKKCPKCGSAKIKQDPDVLDTWFSSWLWPFSTLGWPDKTPALKKFYPNNVLVTDRGIIFFWVARMVMAGLALMKKVPFRHVYIHGTILDENGQKMSKSKPETCIDPLEIIEKYGADALRYSLLLMTTEGQDLKLAESRFQSGRHFCNKLWNATRFALMNLQSYDGPSTGSGQALEKNLTLADRWIWNRLQHTVKEINTHLENFKYFDASQTYYKFVWNEFCDWYLELIKPVVADSKATQWNLFRVLETILRLGHPFMPFITEELWQQLKSFQKMGESLVTAQYPLAVKKILFEKEAKEMMVVQETVNAIRNLRGENNVNPKQKIPAMFLTSAGIYKRNAGIISSLALLSELSFVEQRPEKSAVTVAGDVEIFIPFAQLVNIEEEKARLAKEIEKENQNILRLEGKLANSNFVDRAPKEIVAQEQARCVEAKEKIKKLQVAIEQLQS